jgi:flavorubredoxin
MTATQITEGVYWVGAIDWSVRLFHDFLTSSRGSTYNAFLVLDDKVALFDTVYKDFTDDLIQNISNVIDPASIDYIVVNHVEMDHTGALPELLKIARPEKIFCSPMGHKALLTHFHQPDWPYEIVQTGQRVSLGKKTVRFIESRMLHWPDSMLSYLEEDRLLFSNDIFGQHLATSERFVDQIHLSTAMRHSSKYYANIFMPYSSLVSKFLCDLKQMNLAFDIIAPDHGLIWRKDSSCILEAYNHWSQDLYRKKAVIIYNSMYHSTEKMAKAIGNGLALEGITEYFLRNLQFDHRSDVITDVLDARALILGSATLNNGLLPNMADFLCYLKGLRPKNKIGAAFGSYGWSGEAVKLLNNSMEDMKFQIIDPGIKVQYVPTHEDLKKCVAMGRKIGKAINESQEFCDLSSL